MKKGDLYQERYKILNLIGQGGLSEVFLAFDEFTKRKVALKIYSDNNHSFSTARIQREVEIISNLRHPNIITLFDVGYFQNSYYLVQEFIEGNTLEYEIESSELTIKNAFKYSKDILTALLYLHENDVIHRDLKPYNILIDKRNSRAVLSDFGISITESELHRTTQLTLPGGFIGTPAYMAPEQMGSNNITPRADIYSFGLVIYRMFSGNLPFNYKALNEIYNRAVKSYTVTVDNNALIGKDELEKLINRMLALEPDQRPEINEVLEAITVLENRNNNNTEKIHNGTFEKEKEQNSEKVSAFELKVEDVKKKSGTGFFSDENLRQQEIIASREFYRNHLDLDYKTLLHQAKISFWLWFSTLILGFIVISCLVILLFMGKYIESIGMGIGEVFVYIVQNIFKIREDHYREQANKKTKHLEIGNYWNLITQSIDAIEEQEVKSTKLTQLIDNLNEHIKSS
ncbi:hypothetical protein A8L34_11930 [Bacillus sp. FJAT-27264]|uniref:serine/threonine-protein kinase n=1 Tax=Paenibacillus sp. (strain DSM 101736 / FJAT-27264) TaxID=1850362 RepID=UPI000808113A|nr:serine/threonine-protein kinase [Bacillus sp. FJAT-27264]OBZ14624.1 hypothetical protein A8L34_11930 [Bacillus sp. FJAT-27264]